MDRSPGRVHHHQVTIQRSLCMKKLLCITLAAVLLTGALWAEGSGDSESTAPGEVKFMTSSAKFKEAYREIASMMAANAGLELDIQVIPDDQYQNLVQIKLTSKEVPDLLQQNAPEQYMAMKVAQTMTELSDQPWVDRMVNPSMMQDAEGRIWAMPQQSGSFFGAAYYNKDLLSSLGIENPNPSTFAEFVALLEQIKAADPNVVPLYMNQRDSWTTQIYMTCGYSIALGDRAEQVYGDIMANKLAFSDVPEFKAVLEEYKSLIDRELVNVDHLSAGYDDGLAAVASGRAAMIFNGEWTLSALEAEGAEIGCFPIPWRDNNIMSTAAYVQGFFVPKEASNVNGALQFLNLYSSPEYMNVYFAENPGFPAFSGVDGGDVNPNLTAMIETYMPKGTVYQMNDYVTPLVPLWNELWGAYVEFSAGTMTSDEVLAYWDRTIADHMTASGQPGW